MNLNDTLPSTAAPAIIWALTAGGCSAVMAAVRGRRLAVLVLAGSPSAYAGTGNLSIVEQ